MQMMKKKYDSLLAMYLIACISFIVLLYCLFRIFESGVRSARRELSEDDQWYLEDRIVIRRKRNGLKKSTNRLWTIYKDKHNDWVVPYKLKRNSASQNLEPKEKEAILYVMALIMEKTCLRFMEKEQWKNYETSGGHSAKEWLEIHKDHLGCIAHTGRNKKRPLGNNTIHFKPHCIIRHTHHPNYQKIARLLLTALGVDLEHRRNDRSAFVTIDKDNIRQAKRNHWYFEKNNPTKFDNYDISYNFLSIMHDRKDNWGRKVNGKSLTVISPNTGYEEFEDTMGTLEYPSDKDYLLLNRMYECPKKKTNPRPSNNNHGPGNNPSNTNIHVNTHNADTNTNGLIRPRPDPLPNDSSGESSEENRNVGTEGTAKILGGILGHLHHILNNKASKGHKEESSESSSKSGEELKDKAHDCKQKEFLCLDKDYKNLMEDMCKATCKIKGGINKYKPDCLDVGENCRHKFLECDHSDTYDAMTLECPHTCGRCEQHRQMMAAPFPGAMGSPMMNMQIMGYRPFMDSMMGAMPPMMGGMTGISNVAGMGGMADPRLAIPGVMHPQLMETGMNPMNTGMGGMGVGGILDPSLKVPGVMHPQLMQAGMMGKKK